MGKFFPLQCADNIGNMPLFINAVVLHIILFIEAQYYDGFSKTCGFMQMQVKLHFKDDVGYFHFMLVTKYFYKIRFIDISKLKLT